MSRLFHSCYGSATNVLNSSNLLSCKDVGDEKYVMIKEMGQEGHNYSEFLSEKSYRMVNINKYAISFLIGALLKVVTVSSNIQV